MQPAVGVAAFARRACAIRVPCAIGFVTIVLAVASQRGIAQRTLPVPSTYATIQAAIDAGGTGDLVLVAPGVYRERIDFRGKALAVRSSGGYAQTTIDGGGGGSVVHFQSAEPAAAVLEGFTIKNGLAADGGGILCRGASPTIRSNAITKNAATNRGAGIYADGGAPTISGNLIISNASAAYGGGVYVDKATALIGNNAIVWNTATLGGGGLYLDRGAPIVSLNVIYANRVIGFLPGFGGGVHGDRTAALLADNLISANTISSAQSDGGAISCFESTMTILRNEIQANAARGGAGIYVLNAPGTRISANVISSNRGIQGGGIRCMSAAPIIARNVIEKNLADEGGGLSLDFGASPTVINNIVRANVARDGGGVHCTDRASPNLVNNTIADNTATNRGGGLYCVGTTTGQSAPRVRNSVLWNNLAPTDPEIAVGTNATVTVDHSNVRGGWPGPNNLNADPLFADAAGGDLHLLAASPCVGAGDTVTAPLPQTDFEGDRRGVALDIGADEHALRLYHRGDTKPGRTFELRVVATAGQPVYLGVNTRTLASPINLPGIGPLRLDPVGMAIVMIGSTSTQGLLRVPIRLPASFPPARFHSQALVGGKLTNLLTVDIAP